MWFTTEARVERRVESRVRLEERVARLEERHESLRQQVWTIQTTPPTKVEVQVGPTQ